MRRTTNNDGKNHTSKKNRTRGKKEKYNRYLFAVFVLIIHAAGGVSFARANSFFGHMRFRAIS